MTYSKHIRIKKQFNVDFGILSKEIVQKLSLYMVELAKRNVDVEIIKEKNIEKISQLINESIEAIEPENLIEIGKIIFDEEGVKYDMNNSEDFNRIELLISKVVQYLVERIQDACYSFLDLIQEKK